MKRRRFRCEYRRNGIAATLTDDDDLAHAVLVASKAAVPAVFFLIGGLHIAAEISTINLSDLALAADNTAFHLLAFIRSGSETSNLTSGLLSDWHGATLHEGGGSRSR